MKLGLIKPLPMAKILNQAGLFVNFNASSENLTNKKKNDIIYILSEKEKSSLMLMVNANVVGVH